MSTPLTPREAVVKLVERHAERAGRPYWYVWGKLYDAFESLDNRAVRRLAHNSGRTELDTISEEGWMPELLNRAQKFLPTIPASPEKKKAPVQGSFLNDKEPA